MSDGITQILSAKPSDTWYDENADANRKQLGVSVRVPREVKPYKWTAEDWQEIMKVMSESPYVVFPGVSAEVMMPQIKVHYNGRGGAGCGYVDALVSQGMVPINGD